MARRKRPTGLPAPFLRGLRVEAGTLDGRSGRYPFTLPWLSDAFELEFEQPVTILAGENGTGKSTLIEGVAALAGYDEAGGGKGYRPVDHEGAVDENGGPLAEVLRASWLPRVTDGWFFRAETFFDVARYLDAVGSSSADFLSYSHGEGFLRFFRERLGRQGLYIFDEPESALSPRRQVEFLSILADIQESGRAQVIMATHSPLLMAVPGATLLRMTHRGLSPVSYRDTDHFRLWQGFAVDPEGFLKTALAGDLDTLV